MRQHQPPVEVIKGIRSELSRDLETLRKGYEDAQRRVVSIEEEMRDAAAMLTAYDKFIAGVPA